MKKNVILVGGLVLLVLAGGAYIAMSKKDPAPANNTTQTSTTGTQTDAQATSYTKAQVAEHGRQSDCWTIVSGTVYNITAYVPQHPGGIAEITKICGRDGTSLFEGNREHDATADAQLARLKIGTLAQ